jgi:tetratricopeptide (TPR) repeat protein
MSSSDRIRREHKLRAAEGYLELGLALQALAELNTLSPAGDGRASYLRGEALRELGRYEEALAHLEAAVMILPDEIPAYLALAWCYKRTDRLPLAIEALEKAIHVDPGQGILHYNLACYWSLAQRPRLSLRYLERALELDDRFRELAHEEPDFSLLRDDPRFQALTSVIAKDT